MLEPDFIAVGDLIRFKVEDDVQARCHNISVVTRSKIARAEEATRTEATRTEVTNVDVIAFATFKGVVTKIQRDEKIIVIGANNRLSLIEELKLKEGFKTRIKVSPVITVGQSTHDIVPDEEQIIQRVLLRCQRHLAIWTGSTCDFDWPKGINEITGIGICPF